MLPSISSADGRGSVYVAPPGRPFAPEAHNSISPRQCRGDLAARRTRPRATPEPSVLLPLRGGRSRRRRTTASAHGNAMGNNAARRTRPRAMPEAIPVLPLRGGRPRRRRTTTSAHGNAVGGSGGPQVSKVWAAFQFTRECHNEGTDHCGPSPHYCKSGRRV